MNAATLRALADLIDQGHPADYIGVGDSVTIIVTNEISAARWRATLDARTDIPDADVRHLRPIVVAT